MPPVSARPWEQLKSSLHNYRLTNILNAVVHLQLEVSKSSQNLFKHPTNKNHHNYLHNHIKSISTWSLSSHQRSNDFLNIRSDVVTRTTYSWFVAALKACTVTCTDSRPLWRNCGMRTKWKSSQPWLSESIVTHPWVKPHAGTGCWGHKRRFKTSLRFIIVLIANLGDFDEILQLGISDWHSTFCKS